MHYDATHLIPLFLLLVVALLLWRRQKPPGPPRTPQQEADEAERWRNHEDDAW